MLSSERTARPDWKSPCVLVKAEEAFPLQTPARSGGWWAPRPRAISSNTGSIWDIVAVFPLHSWLGRGHPHVCVIYEREGLSIGVFWDKLGPSVSLPPAFCWGNSQWNPEGSWDLGRLGATSPPLLQRLLEHQILQIYCCVGQAGNPWYLRTSGRAGRKERERSLVWHLPHPLILTKCPEKPQPCQLKQAEGLWGWAVWQDLHSSSSSSNLRSGEESCPGLLGTIALSWQSQFQLWWGSFLLLNEMPSVQQSIDGILLRRLKWNLIGKEASCSPGRMLPLWNAYWTYLSPAGVHHLKDVVHVVHQSQELLVFIIVSFPKDNGAYDIGDSTAQHEGWVKSCSCDFRNITDY